MIFNGRPIHLHCQACSCGSGVSGPAAPDPLIAGVTAQCHALRGHARWSWPISLSARDAVREPIGVLDVAGSLPTIVGGSVAPRDVGLLLRVPHVSWHPGLRRVVGDQASTTATTVSSQGPAMNERGVPDQDVSLLRKVLDSLQRKPLAFAGEIGLEGPDMRACRRRRAARALGGPRASPRVDTCRRGRKRARPARLDRACVTRGRAGDSAGSWQVGRCYRSASASRLARP